MMKAFFVDVYNETFRRVDIPDELETFYQMIDCRCIDIVERSVGGVYYQIICDDEGLFHEPQKISAIDEDGQPMLVGNLIICSCDNKGNLAGLEDRDFDQIESCVNMGYTNRYPLGYPMLMRCGY